jgi:hypothetical protein
MKLALALFMVFAPAAFAQGPVTIGGTVTGENGAAVPQATVRAVNTLTGAVRDSRTSEAGSYGISQLPAGVYTVRAEPSGFKTFIQEGIQVQMDENRPVNVALQVGAVTERIEVTAESAQVETRSGAIREVVDSLRLVEPPLNGRNALQLQYLAPRSSGVAARDQAQNESVSINGSRTNGNNYQLDGGDNHDPYFDTPVEAFSALNRLNFGNPNANQSSAQFGQITSAGAPPVIPLACKLQFWTKDW